MGVLSDEQVHLTARNCIFVKEAVLITLFLLLFLVACTRFYKSLCWSVRWLVRLLVGHLVAPSVAPFVSPFVGPLVSLLHLFADFGANLV